MRRKHPVTYLFPFFQSLNGNPLPNNRRYMEERAERVDEHIKQLESLRVHDAEEYNLVKIKLETDVQVLEQQLQQVCVF